MTPVDVSAWASETIGLPPAFAPLLPGGSEVLRFAPGWRDPDADDFWSYAFVMWLEAPAPDRAGLEALFEAYYDGLLYAVAPQVGEDAAKVEVTELGDGSFAATMQLVDAFTTLEPLRLLARIDVRPSGTSRSEVFVRASPQGHEHPVWNALSAAIQAIEDERTTSDNG